MTTSNFRKEYTQLKMKQTKWKKYLKHNSPKKRSVGASLKKCRLCGSHRGFIQKYDINMCRRCFREHAKEIGFKKYS
ncbi:MAG: 30S ribosomal protein S14 [Candidatus Woesearchaeota archaeon]